MRAWIGLVLALACAVAAQWNPATMGMFSVATLSDDAVVAKLQARFHATGRPYFLLGNPSGGLQQGDILRFADKAFLVDADVWQTLSSEGALRNLRQSPLAKVQAGATPSAWTARAKAVGNAKERKLYEFGASLLKSMEQSMGGVPDGQRLFLSTEGGRLVITAPAGFLDKIRAVAIEREKPKDAVALPGKPRWVSPAPSDTVWIGQELTWQGWAVDDSGGSAASFQYSMVGALPEGLQWDAELRTIRGTPTSPGPSRVRLVVSGARGSDTLAWNPSVFVRSPPKLEGDPQEASCHEPWIFRPWISSPDWHLSRLQVRLEQTPSGMSWDSARGEVVWPEPARQCGKDFSVTMVVTDPVGGQVRRGWTLPVREREHVLATEGLRVDLPFDTLLQGKWYTWEPGALMGEWKRQGIRLDSVTGNLDLDWNGKRLVFRSARMGTARITFWFREGERSRSIQHTRVVRPYEVPRFAGDVGGSDVPEGSVRSYRPVVSDPQGGPLELGVEFPSDAPMQWTGSELLVAPKTSGIWAARLVAKDTLGQSAERWVAFQAHGRSPTGWRLETRWADEVNPWIVQYDFGRGRAGFFSPHPAHFFTRSQWGADFPFLTLGADLLPASLRSQGASLGGDVGLGLRVPDRKLLTGGIMTRLGGRSVPRGWVPLSVECEVFGWIRQAIMLTDTSGMVSLLDSVNGVQDLEKLQGQYAPLVGGVLRDAFDDNNIVILSRLEAWVRGPWNLSAGAGILRDDRLISGKFHQRFSAGLRARPQAKWLGTLELTGRGGWGPGESGWGARLDLDWASGILP
ncbi:MAG: hypothetical protein IPO40_22735 [Fibrobacteres bacterium]|nr:hypothetical protein [Fibrobacterota bacterium]